MSDTTGFSPLIQKHIDEYEAAVAADRLARETDLEYLRRVRPGWSEGERMRVMFMCMIAHVRLRDQVKLFEEVG